VQHAISKPPFQRRCLQFLQRAAETLEVPAWQPAYLLDRIRVFEGKSQVYGTQFDRDENGVPHPYPVEDLPHVDERRQRIGLDSLAAQMQKMREEANQDCSKLLVNREESKRNYDAWLREVGWRD
jgi:hypothetical protein